MITATIYLQPDITVDADLVGDRKLYMYNYRGIHYRVFRSIIDLQRFFRTGEESFVFDCESETELEKYLEY
jgi:hypothetical protein